MALIKSYPLTVVHVVYRFDTGGLENGVVNLINNMSPLAYRHVVLSLTEITEFRKRIHRTDVQFYELNKKPGHAIWLYPKLFWFFRKLKPDIVHTRNLAALEVAVPAWFAGVAVRVHGEHGRDIGDYDGSNLKFQRMRRLYKRFITEYVALSRDLSEYLVECVRLPVKKVNQIYNGVDLNRFNLSRAGNSVLPVDFPFNPTQHWIVGTVGRMQIVKDQVTLVRAFIAVIERSPVLRTRLRLVLVGEGPLRNICETLLHQSGMGDLAWFSGSRDDVSIIMRNMHCFVLPSLAEGISNTILEAMASGLPIIATDVGGNADLVVDGVSGYLVSAEDFDKMSDRIIQLAENPERAEAMGRAGRLLVEENFSLDAMVNRYKALYDRLLDVNNVDS